MRFTNMGLISVVVLWIVAAYANRSEIRTDSPPLVADGPVFLDKINPESDVEFVHAFVNQTDGDVRIVGGSSCCSTQFIDPFPIFVPKGHAISVRLKGTVPPFIPGHMTHAEWGGEIYVEQAGNVLQTVRFITGYSLANQQDVFSPNIGESVLERHE